MGVNRGGNDYEVYMFCAVRPKILSAGGGSEKEVRPPSPVRPRVLPPTCSGYSGQAYYM